MKEWQQWKILMEITKFYIVKTWQFLVGYQNGFEELHAWICGQKT